MALSDGMLGSGATFLAICQKWRPLRPQFWKNNFREHLWTQRGYSRDYFEPNFRSLGPLVWILHVFFVEKLAFLAKNGNFWSFWTHFFANFVVEKLILWPSTTFTSIFRRKTCFFGQKRQFLKLLDTLFANFVVKKLILWASITFSSIIAGKQILKS